MLTVFSRRLRRMATAFVVMGICSVSPAFAQVVNSVAGTNANSQITLTTTLSSVVSVKVNQASSTLTAAFNPSLMDSKANVPSQDFKVLGDVVVSSASARVQCAVSTISLKLANGSDTITVNLSGTIGGATISTAGFTPVFSSKQAAINIIGDIDESTVTTVKAPGTYTGGLTITATLL